MGEPEFAQRVIGVERSGVETEDDAATSRRPLPLIVAQQARQPYACVDIYSAFIYRGWSVAREINREFLAADQVAMDGRMAS